MFAQRQPSVLWITLSARPESSPSVHQMAGSTPARPWPQTLWLVANRILGGNSTSEESDLGPRRAGHRHSLVWPLSHRALDTRLPGHPTHRAQLANWLASVDVETDSASASPSGAGHCGFLPFAAWLYGQLKRGSYGFVVAGSRRTLLPLPRTSSSHCPSTNSMSGWWSRLAGAWTSHVAQTMLSIARHGLR